MDVALAYSRRTICTGSLTSSALAFATNLRRAPVAFHGRVHEPVLLRQLLLALHEVVISDYTERVRWAWTLDPVITVHPDSLFFEAFSNDESSYARLDAPIECFEPEGTPSYGTTNIDFTWALRVALQRLRSSRTTTFSVGAGGFEVATTGPGGTAHLEQKVTLPESWLKGFLQVQSSLALRPFLFDVRPADLLPIGDVDHVEPRSDNVFHAGANGAQRGFHVAQDLDGLCIRVARADNVAELIGSGRPGNVAQRTHTYGSRISDDRFPWRSGGYGSTVHVRPHRLAFSGRGARQAAGVKVISIALPAL